MLGHLTASISGYWTKLGWHGNIKWKEQVSSQSECETANHFFLLLRDAQDAGSYATIHLYGSWHLVHRPAKSRAIWKQQGEFKLFHIFHFWFCIAESMLIFCSSHKLLDILIRWTRTHSHNPIMSHHFLSQCYKLESHRMLVLNTLNVGGKAPCSISKNRFHSAFKKINVPI